VLGPNGAGKTTAIRILATLLRPDGGRAVVGGLDVVRHAAQVRRLIGLTGQYASVDEDSPARRTSHSSGSCSTCAASRRRPGPPSCWAGSG